jgi:type IV pilus assembly protein PilK
MSWSLQKLKVLSGQEFSLWESLLEKRTGIQLTHLQRVLLQTQVTIRMRELRISDPALYFYQVKDDKAGAAEWEVLIDRLVIKETSFFRHRPSLNLVKRSLEHKLIHGLLNESFEIWSVGCSTGEESYGLAAIADDCFRQRQGNYYFGVTAVDVSLPALSRAREGVYGRRSLNLLDVHERFKYFDALENDEYQVIERLRRRVCFSQLNIMNINRRTVQPMDVIFCQNVLIYFRRWRRREILQELVKHLKPGGILVIGLGEVTDWECANLKRVINNEVQAYVKCS